MNNGFIKLHRDLLNWEWYTSPETCHVFIYCLLKASHKDRSWRGIPIRPGQFIAGREKIAEETGLSVQTVRTCINRLKSTKELTTQSTRKYTLITVCNWETYQTQDESANQQTNQNFNPQLTNNQPTINQQLTTDKNVKNVKKGRNTHTHSAEAPPRREDFPDGMRGDSEFTLAVSRLYWPRTPPGPIDNKLMASGLPDDARRETVLEFADWMHINGDVEKAFPINLFRKYLTTAADRLQSTNEDDIDIESYKL